MKRIIKVLTVVAIISVFCMIFTGCDMLDEMKANHAVMSDDMSKISLRGETYLRLPDGTPPFVSPNYEVVFTTKADVPVLLSEDFGYLTDYDPLRGLLKVESPTDYNYDGPVIIDYYGYMSSGQEYLYFCKEDLYDKYADIIENKEADRIGFYDYGETYYTEVLSSETSKEILNLLTSLNGMTNETYEEAMSKECDCIYELYRCDKEILLRETLYNYALSITDKREVYFVNHTNGTASKLSDAAAEEITSDYYEYGSNQYGN